MDTIWYLLLPDMQRFDIKVTRSWFKALIRKICDEASKKRTNIGIVTGARAELYFDGGWESVSFDSIKELAAKGTDLIFIEKEGIIDELNEHDDKYGVAMVNSRGYLTEYAHDLIEAAKQSGANIIVVTDNDLSGINLASKCDEDVYFITMDNNTLEYFGLQKNERIVVSATNTKLINKVERIVKTDSRFK
jgi:5S rRNA maturation endonuclease (ribonuclease M5)